MFSNIKYVNGCRFAKAKANPIHTKRTHNVNVPKVMENKFKPFFQLKMIFITSWMWASRAPRAYHSYLHYYVSLIVTAKLDGMNGNESCDGKISGFTLVRSGKKTNSDEQ